LEGTFIVSHNDPGVRAANEMAATFPAGSLPLLTMIVPKNPLMTQEKEPRTKVARGFSLP
jgi:hypothetical protein